MDKQSAAPPHTLGESAVGSGLQGTGTIGREEAGGTTALLEQAGLVTGGAWDGALLERPGAPVPSVANRTGANQPVGSGPDVHKLTELPPLRPADGPSSRPLIAVMGCVVQDIVVKPNGPLTANGSTMSRDRVRPRRVRAMWPGRRRSRERASASWAMPAPMPWARPYG